MTHRIYRARYLPGDETRFTPRPDLSEDMARTGWDWAQGAPPGHAWTLMRPAGEVLGVAGVTDLAGHWQAWSWLSEITDARDWLALLWHARAALSMVGQLGVREVQSFCRVERPAARACLERLGFVPAEPAPCGLYMPMLWRA